MGCNTLLPRYKCTWQCTGLPASCYSVAIQWRCWHGSWCGPIPAKKVAKKCMYFGHIWRIIAHIWSKIEPQLLQNTKRKSHVFYWTMRPLMTFNNGTSIPQCKRRLQIWNKPVNQQWIILISNKFKVIHPKLMQFDTAIWVRCMLIHVFSQLVVASWKLHN